MAQIVGGAEIVRTYEAEVAFARGLGVVAGTAADQVKLPAAIGDRIVGVAIQEGDPAATGKDAGQKNPAIQSSGEVIAISGAAITRGAPVKVDAAGKFIAAGGEATTTVVNVAGIAITATSAADEEFVLQLAPGRYVHP